MKIARYDNGTIGLIHENRIYDLSSLYSDAGVWPPRASLQLIKEFETKKDELAARIDGFPSKHLEEVSLEAPLVWPNKVIAYPVNYHAHGAEMQANYRATNQGFFLKPSSSIAGPNDQIVLPELPGREIHHECELAIIIGKECRNIAREDWEDYVLGYCCLMDMVVRGREERVMRKAYDTFCPIGPWITPKSEVSDVQSLEMKLWVNDELRQHANTRDLVLDIPGMVQTAAAVTTLFPGDVIATGTPQGVGPIVPGDRVRIEIEQLGSMQMDVIQGQGGWSTVFEEAYVPPIIKQEIPA